MVAFYYHFVVRMEPKQGYFSFTKARNEELCQDRHRLALCKLHMCSCEGTRVQPVLFQPQAFGEEAGKEAFAGLALSRLFLSRVFVACLSEEWETFLCVLFLQAGPVYFQLGHCWCACLLLLFIHLFIWGGGVRWSCQRAHWVHGLQAETASTASASALTSMTGSWRGR